MYINDYLHYIMKDDLMQIKFTLHHISQIIVQIVYYLVIKIYITS